MFTIRTLSIDEKLNKIPSFSFLLCIKFAIIFINKLYIVKFVISINVERVSKLAIFMF